MIFPLNQQLIRHRFPTSLANVSECFGIRWLTNLLECLFSSAVFKNIWIVLHKTWCSFQCFLANFVIIFNTLATITLQNNGTSLFFSTIITRLRLQNITGYLLPPWNNPRAFPWLPEPGHPPLKWPSAPNLKQWLQLAPQPIIWQLHHPLGRWE